MLELKSENFVSLDFDSEEEFLVFWVRYRTDLLEVFRYSTMMCPIITFEYCEQWIIHRLTASATEQNTSCSILDPAYLEWEALSAVIDGVFNRILLVTEKPSVLRGLALLEQCLKVQSKDPLIISVLLSCISSLFVFLSISSAGNAVEGK